MSAQALSVISGIAGVLGVAVGALLLIVPVRVLRERTALRRWFLEINLAALLDQRHTIERPLYRHHYAFGAIVIAGAIAWLVTLWEVRGHTLVTRMLPEILGAWGTEAVILASWVFAAFALCMGALLLIRPSAIKPFETAANRWFEPLPSTEGALIVGLILRAPRLIAVLLLAAGIACFALAVVQGS